LVVKLPALVEASGVPLLLFKKEMVGLFQPAGRVCPRLRLKDGRGYVAAQTKLGPDFNWDVWISHTGLRSALSDPGPSLRVIGCWATNGRQLLRRVTKPVA